MVGSEAHTQSVAAKSGTIKPEHVFAALKALEMGEFVDKCKVGTGCKPAHKKAKCNSFAFVFVAIRDKLPGHVAKQPPGLP